MVTAAFLYSQMSKLCPYCSAAKPKLEELDKGLSEGRVLSVEVLFAADQYEDHMFFVHNMVK